MMSDSDTKGTAGRQMVDCWFAPLSRSFQPDFRQPDADIADDTVEIY